MDFRDPIENYRQLRRELLTQLDSSLFAKDRSVAGMAVFAYAVYWTLFWAGVTKPAALPLICVALGVIGEFLSIANHDVLHGSVLDSKRGAIFFCLPISFINNISPNFWKYWHNFHHDSIDRWTKMKRPYEMGFESTGYPRLRALLGPFELFFYKTLHMTSTQFRFIFNRRLKNRTHLNLKRIVALEVLLILIVKLSIFLALPFRSWLWLELGPLLIQNILSSIFVVTQHAESLDKKDATRTFSVLTPTWISHISLNLGFHNEHHLFPNLPSRNLPLVRDMVEARHPDFKMPTYRLFDALRRIYFK